MDPHITNMSENYRYLVFYIEWGHDTFNSCSLDEIITPDCHNIVHMFKYIESQKNINEIFLEILNNDVKNMLLNHDYDDIFAEQIIHDYVNSNEKYITDNYITICLDYNQTNCEYIGVLKLDKNNDDKFIITVSDGNLYPKLIMNEQINDVLKHIFVSYELNDNLHVSYCDFGEYSFTNDEVNVNEIFDCNVDKYESYKKLIIDKLYDDADKLLSNLGPIKIALYN